MFLSVLLVEYSIPQCLLTLRLLVFQLYSLPLFLVYWPSYPHFLLILILFTSFCCYNLIARIRVCRLHFLSAVLFLNFHDLVLDQDNYFYFGFYLLRCLFPPLTKVLFKTTPFLKYLFYVFLLNCSN